MISVIIPAYNAQAYLRECLESVLAQSFSDWEAIVVDDGSTDATAEIARGYQARDHRIRVFSTVNGGVSSARNRALEMARGEWVTFLDSDDLLPQGALQAYMDNAADGVDVIAGRWARADVSITSSADDESPRHYGAESALAGGLYQTGISTMVGAKMYSRRTLGNVRFHNDIRYEDLVFFCEALLAASEVVGIADVTYLYRDNPDSFINTFSPERLDVLAATERIESMCASAPSLLRAARDRRLSAAFNIYGLVAKYAPCREEDMKYCWDIIRDNRRSSLFNGRVRMKNKAGIILSYLGPTFLKHVMRMATR
ncbi:MAG: glycosyltransferase family 2 protein [Duncaniella sp.]|nr:glycosyltransferase family 2 protein [Duncaniella sp.]